MRQFLLCFMLFATLAGCEKKADGYGEKQKVRIRFKNDIPGVILDARVKLANEVAAVELGSLAQGESSKYIEDVDFYKEGTDASPAWFDMHYQLTGSTASSFNWGRPTRVASATTQKLEPGDHTIIIRRETVANVSSFIFLLP